MADPEVNLFGPSTPDDIRVGYISTTRGYVTGVGVNDANKYAKKDPGTTFILQNREYIKYLNINDVNALTPEVLETSGIETGCSKIDWDAPVGPPEVIFSGGGGVGVVGNPVFGTDGALLAVDLVSGGFGYKYAPVTKLRDVSGKGAGAHLLSIVGEIPDSEILYDKREDFEEYIIDEDNVVGIGSWYGPDGKVIGRWDPSLYLGDEEPPFSVITDTYIQKLQKIATSGVGGVGGAGQNSAGVFWWAAKDAPKLVAGNGKTTRKIYKVEHVAWNETPPPKDSEGKITDWSTNGWLNTHAISPIPMSHAKGSAQAGKLFSMEWDVEFPWDGEYSFRGSADNEAWVYFDNQELTHYKLGSGGAAGKVLSLPTVVKKEVTEGTHTIRIDLKNFKHIVQKQVQASSKTYGSLLQLEDIPHVAAEDQGGVTYDDLQCYAKVGRFFDINANKAKYRVDPSLNQPEGSELEVEYKVTSASAFVNKIEVKDLFTEQGPEVVDGAPTLPEISQIEASAKFSSRGSGKDTKYYMTVTGNDLLDIQLEFRKHRDDSTRGGGHSVNAITIQTEDAPLELLSGPLTPDAAWPFDNAMITVKTGRFKNGKEYEITFSEARFQAVKPSPRIQFFGLNPSNNPIEVRNNNKTLCLKDSSGSDCNAQFNIDSGDFTFAPDGRSVVGNRGMITMTLSWNDNPNIAGKAVNQIQFAGQKWFQTNCIPTTGVTPDGYANTARGYVKFNDGFRVTESYVTSFVSTWLNQTIKTGFTYQEVFDQIVSSYATILSRKPEADGFDYWVNSFRDNASWTLSNLNAAISADANNPNDGELLLHTTHNGVEGNYDECDENFFASNYGQSRTSGSQTRTFYYTTENAPPPEITNNDKMIAFYDEDVSEGASTSDPDLDGDVRAHFNILNIEQLSESVPSIPGKLELKQLNKTFKKTVIVGKVYPVIVTNAGQGLMGNTPAPIGALKAVDVVNQDVQNNNNTETSVEITNVFSTTEYQNSANRKLWRTNVNNKGGFMNEYGVCPFDTKDTLPDNPYAGTHTIRWNNVNFPISGNYTIRVAVDDNVDLKIGTAKGGNVVTISKKGYTFPAGGGIKSTGVGTYVRYIEAGKYTIQADLEQIPGGKFGFGKIRKDGAVHDYSGYGLNPMALAVSIDTTVANVEEVVTQSWHGNPMGVALNIKAPIPPAPVQPIPKQEGRCPSNPVWSTRFPNAKDGTWYPVRFDSWGKFHNKYGMSPVPPLPIGGTDNGGVPFINRWDVDIPYDGWYKLKAIIDDIGKISIDGDIKLELSNKRKVEYEETLFYLSEGRKEIEIEIENNSTRKVKMIDQKVFNTKDWVNIDPPRGGGIQKDVNFKVTSNSAFINSITIKGLIYEQAPKFQSSTATKTNLVPGPTTPASVEFIKRGKKYFLKASGNNKVQVKFDFRCVAPIFKGGAVIQPTCVPTTGITPAGYANTTKGYLLYNDGFTSNGDFVTSYISTWSTEIIKGILGVSKVYFYQEVFEQITSSYATILSRKPEAAGFDYWVNSFKDNASWTLEDLNNAISADANNPNDGELLIHSSHDGLEGNYDECNDNFFAFDYGQQTITNIAERAAIESVTIQTMDAPLRFDNLHETTTLPDWPFKGSSVVKDAVFENGKEYEVTFNGLLSRARSTPPIKYIGLKTPGDKKYINSKKLVFDDNSPNGFDVNATFTIDSGDVTFSSDGNSLVGSKSGNVTMTYSWNDHPNISGVVLDEIKIGKTTWKQSGTNGKVTRTFNFIADPNPTPSPEISSGGATDNSDTNEPNQRICFYDTDTSAGATPGPDLDGDVRAHFTAINVIQMDEPDTVEEDVIVDSKKLVQSINPEPIIKDVVIGQVYDVEIANAGQGLMGNYPAPLAALKAKGGVLMAEDIPNVAAEDQGGVTFDDLVCSVSHGRFYDIQGNKCKYIIDPPDTGTTVRYGITYDGPPLSTYGSYDGFGALITPTWTTDEEYIKTHNGTTWVMKFTGVDFPVTGDYDIKTIVDDSITVKLDGEEIIKGKVGKGVQHKRFKATKGKRNLELVLFNIDLGRSYYNGNPCVAGVSITRKVDAFAGTPDASKSWMENPISISAELVPPPCPRKVIGTGVVTEVEVIDPGNGYTPLPPPGEGYPAIVTLGEIPVVDPGINYDCSKDKVVIEPANGAEATLECDNFGRIKQVNVTNPGQFTAWPQIYIDSPTGVSATLRPKFKVTRELPPAVMIDEGLDPDKLIQVTDLVGIKQTGYYDGKPYYGAVFYKDGVRYAGYYETTGVLVQIYDTMQESIDGMVTTPPSAIQRQGTDIASDDPNLDIPNTPDNLI